MHEMDWGAEVADGDQNRQRNSPPSYHDSHFVDQAYLRDFSYRFLMFVLHTMATRWSVRKESALPLSNGVDTIRSPA